MAFAVFAATSGDREAVRRHQQLVPQLETQPLVELLGRVRDTGEAGRALPADWPAYGDGAAPRLPDVGDGHPRRALELLVDVGGGIEPASGVGDYHLLGPPHGPRPRRAAQDASERRVPPV